MGKVTASAHVQIEVLSALADGELEPEATLAARAHAETCVLCAALLARFARLDKQLAEPAPLGCAAAAPLLSARLDGEASAEERTVLDAHLVACAGCRDRRAAWTALEAALRPERLSHPSARVDAAMTALTRPERSAAPPTGRIPVPSLVLRGAAVAAVVLAVVVAGLAAPGGPDQRAQVTEETNSALVAAVQQVLFNPRTNLLYVLRPDAGAVDVLRAGTHDLVARINVGGRPSALALDEEANRILVLDASNGTLTEIDGDGNVIVSATAVSFPSAPTSLQVSGGKIYVSGAAEPGGHGGSVSVLDVATKRVERTHQVEVAPRRVTIDPRSGRMALVSAESTTIVDSSYQRLVGLPGGVAAAFAERGDSIALLSAEGGGTRVLFAGSAAPPALALEGAPASIVSLPDGGFAVLVDENGAGRLHVIGADGRVTASAEVSLVGGDLSYDRAADRFTIGSGENVASVPAPTVVAAASPTGTPDGTFAPAADPSDLPSDEPVPTESAEPAPSEDPTLAEVTPAPTVTAPPTPALSVIDRATEVAPGVYRLGLRQGAQPVLVAGSGLRLWFTDQTGRINSIDTSNGEPYTVAELPRGARVSALLGNDEFVFALDPDASTVYVVGADEALRAVSVNLLDHGAPATVAADGRLWFAAPDAGGGILFALDPRTHHVEGVEVGRATALSSDTDGRIWFANESRGVVGTYDPATKRLTEVATGHLGVTALLPDRYGTVWLVTGRGDVFALRNGVVTRTLGVQRSITSLALDQLGRVWYLAPAPGGLQGVSYAPIEGGGAGRLLPGPATSLAFSPIGRAWLADPLGGFFVVPEFGR